MVAPLLVASGVAVRSVAGAALVSTFVSSIVGLAAYVLFAGTTGTAAPDWTLGLCLGLGGLGGSYAGARAQRHLPDAAMTGLVATLAAATGLLYLVQAITT